MLPTQLSQEQLEALLEDYYDPEKKLSVSQIVEKYDLHVRPNELSKYFPDIQSDQICPYCDTNLTSKAPSRSSVSGLIFRCGTCSHSSRPNCFCENCRRKKQQIEANENALKKALVLRFYGNPATNISAAHEITNLDDAVSLRALVAHAVDEDVRTVRPWSQTQVRFGPTDRLILDTVHRLYDSTLIAPDAESALSSFHFGSLDEAPRYYPNKVNWIILPGLSKETRISFLRDLDPMIDLLLEYHDQQVRMSRKLLHAEALEYYLYKLLTIDIEVEVGDKTKEVFSNLINKFSLSKIYQIVYQAIKSTHFFVAQNDIPEYRAKNMYIGSVERTASKYEAEGWLKDYRRDFNCPQTTLSATYFNGALRLGEKYFSSSLSQISPPPANSSPRP